MPQTDTLTILCFPPTGEVDLSGTRTALQLLAAKLALGTGTVQAEDIDTDYGQVALTRIHVFVAQAPVTITASLTDRSLSIAGAMSSLRGLAQEINEIADLADGAHFHIEHYPDHPYLAEGSQPLVVNSPHGGMPAR